MKKSSIIIIFCSVSFLVFIFFPVDKKDIPGLSLQETECAKSMAYVTFDNPIERGFIKDVAITSRDQNIIIATAFTFGGIPMSAVAVDCPNGDARRL